MNKTSTKKSTSRFARLFAARHLSRLLALLLAVMMILAAVTVFTGCKARNSGEDGPNPDAQTDADAGDGTDSGDASDVQGTAIDYMVLVNKENKLPDGWEEALDIVEFQDSQGWDVKVERGAYEAYLLLKAALEKEGVYVDLDSAYRSVAEQQQIVDDFTEKYGADYVKLYVAVPGFSEHHTGLALDLYLTVDGVDIVENEDLVQYPELWAVIQEKAPEYGFILRYLPGKVDITGYGYEPWHLRYIDDPAVAQDIMDRGITFEEYLGRLPSFAVPVDYGTSELYTQEEMDRAITTFKAEFENWSGCELHAVRYLGDDLMNSENLAWVNHIKEARDIEGPAYTEVIAFASDFHSPTDEEDLTGTAWEADTEYTNWEWWLARSDGGPWELVEWGY
ncbi:MAG: M15 family metallopeptidase [Mogibacterium sp.]|nr:M15 family metallopeptidase [Mogibacterium sp.]